MNTGTKICPFCAETIKEAAKICPYCRGRQNRFYVPATEILGLVILVAIVAAMGFLAEQVFGGNSDEDSSLVFKMHRHDLSGSDLAWVPNGRDQYRLTGYVTNAGSYAWRIRELAVLVHDTQGRMTDVARVTLDKDARFTVLPGQKHALSTVFNALVMETNSTVTLRVQEATDGREHYNPT